MLTEGEQGRDKPSLALPYVKGWERKKNQPIPTLAFPLGSFERHHNSAALSLPPFFDNGEVRQVCGSPHTHKYDAW
jgi:hypothetical protein